MDLANLVVLRVLALPATATRWQSVAVVVQLDLPLAVLALVRARTRFRAYIVRHHVALHPRKVGTKRADSIPRAWGVCQSLKKVVGRMSRRPAFGACLCVAILLHEGIVGDGERSVYRVKQEALSGPVLDARAVGVDQQSKEHHGPGASPDFLELCCWAHPFVSHPKRNSATRWNGGVLLIRNGYGSRPFEIATHLVNFEFELSRFIATDSRLPNTVLEVKQCAAHSDQRGGACSRILQVKANVKDPFLFWNHHLGMIHEQPRPVLRIGGLLDGCGGRIAFPQMVLIPAARAEPGEYNRNECRPQSEIAMVPIGQQNPGDNDENCRQYPSDVNGDFHAAPFVMSTRELWLGLYFAFVIGFVLGGFAVAAWHSRRRLR